MWKRFGLCEMNQYLIKSDFNYVFGLNVGSFLSRNLYIIVLSYPTGKCSRLSYLIFQ